MADDPTIERERGERDTDESDPERAYYSSLVTLSPSTWPEHELAVQPSDMTRILPMGQGLSGHVVLRPYDDLTQVASSWNNWYGVQSRTGNPLDDAPLTDPAGGTVYFDAGASESDFRGLLRLLQIADTDVYAAFVESAADSREERFLYQLRVLGPAALAAYGVPAAEAPRQRTSVHDLLWTFVARETAERPKVIQGTFGGDGDWARERLCFGVMVENSSWMAYRIWSRAWLITK